MKDTKYTYEQLQESIRESENDKAFINAKEYFKMKNKGVPKEEYIDKIKFMERRGSSL
ncbi:MAG: hypothetical protein ACK5HR_03925 [Mycoplasmatales bacterium]